MEKPPENWGVYNEDDSKSYSNTNLERNFDIENTSPEKPEEKEEQQPEKEEEKPKESQQTPEQQPEVEKSPESLKAQDEKLINAALERDVLFYDKLDKKWNDGMTAPEIINQIKDNYETRMQEEFKSLPSETQDLLMDFLGDRFGIISKQIEETQNKLQDKTIDEPTKQQLENNLTDFENQQKALRARTQAYHLALHPEKPPKKTLEKPLEKGEAEKFVKHFQEELKKVENLPQETEIKKWRKTDECLRLLNDWLPFGYLDDFAGVEELMNTLEQSKSKLRISSPAIQENAGRKIALEMAFQYKFWEKDDQEKINKINNFVDTWLKDKSIFYQRGENFKKTAYRPDKISQISQWFVDQTGEGLKLLGERDKTLNQISQILTLQNVPYSGLIDQLTSNIENKNIQFNSLAEVRKIEEWQDETKLKYLMNFKAGLGTLPSMPLKVEFYEKLIEEKAKNLSPENKEMLLSILESWEKGKQDKNSKEKINQLKQKISGLKEKELPKPEAVEKAKEFIKSEEKKGKESIFQKMGGWNTVGGIAGFSLMMFLILIFLGEFKLLEKASDIGGGGDGGKGGKGGKH